MKTKLLAITCLILTTPALGSSRSETLRGGLVGAATGALLAELSSDISSRTAIPLFAGVGALTGYARYQHRNRDDYAYYRYRSSPDWQYSYGGHPYYHPRGYRQRWNRPRHHIATPVRIAPIIRAAQQTATTRPQPENRHPGVVQIPVQIKTPTGFPLTITIMRTGNQYVGPRGETYPEMPTAAQLQQRYKP